MKKYLHTLLAALLILSAASAQTPQMQWQKCIGGSSNEYSYDIRLTNDGGYIIAGCSSSVGYGGYDGWIVKLTAGGAIDWQKRLGGSHDDLALSAQQTFDGGYIIAGNTSQPTPISHLIMVAATYGS